MSSGEELHHLREHYAGQPLLKSDLDPDPVAQFRKWFGEARESGIPEPNAMTLGTAGADGRVSLRTVLLKAYDAKGFVFFTNYGSRKARQIGENPSASLLFPWVALARQVEISGRVEKISVAEFAGLFPEPSPREPSRGLGFRAEQHHFLPRGAPRQICGAQGEVRLGRDPEAGGVGRLPGRAGTD